MSVDGQILGASTIAGGGAGTAASLVNAGNPVLIGILAAAGLIIVMGVLTRFAQRKQ